LNAHPCACNELARIVRATLRLFRHPLAAANGDPKIKGKARSRARFTHHGSHNMIWKSLEKRSEENGRRTLSCRSSFLFVLTCQIFSTSVVYSIPPPPYDWHETQLSIEQRDALEQEACAKPYSLKMDYSAAGIEEYFSDHHKELWASTQCESHRKIEGFAIRYKASCKEVSNRWDCDPKMRREEFAAKVFDTEVKVHSSNMTIDEVLRIFQFMARQEDPHSYSMLVARSDCGFYRVSDAKVTTYCAGEYIEIAVDCTRRAKCRYSILPRKS